MKDPFFIAHQQGVTSLPSSLPNHLPSSPEGSWLPWSTCWRSLILGFGKFLLPQKLSHDLPTELRAFEKLKTANQFNSFEKLRKSENCLQFYTGHEAYSFCLGVVCGLQSPIPGETEIFGQFKNLIKKHPFENHYSSQKLKATLESICKDAKYVRQKHLLNLGSQSYGGIVRNLLQPGEEVHFLGAGHIVQKILPWMAKFSGPIHIHCRNPVKVLNQIQDQSRQPNQQDQDKNQVSGRDLDKLSSTYQNQNITVHSLHDPLSTFKGSLIVAVPLPTSNLLHWMGKNRPRSIIDLRGESRQDPLPSFLQHQCQIQCLNHIFEEMERNKEGLSLRIEQARSTIVRLTTQRNHFVQIRPFGWEDICV